MGTMMLGACAGVDSTAKHTPESFLALKNRTPLTAKSYRLTCEMLTYDGERSRPASVVVKLGEEALIGNTVDWVVPTSYRLAELSSRGAGRYTVNHPTRPFHFDKVQVGRVLKLKLRHQGPFVEAHGVLLTRRGTNDGRSYGDATLPIHDQRGQLLTENSLTLPEFRTMESYVHFIGSPSKVHRIELPQQRVQLFLTVEPVK